MTFAANQQARKPDAPPRERANKGSDQEGATTTTGSATDEDAPPLPDEPAPDAADDGWVYNWNETASAWWFYNRLTGVSQWENPRAPAVTADSSESYDRKNFSNAAASPSSLGAPGTSPSRKRVCGGYNPKIHGNWDPKADYAIEYAKDQGEAEQSSRAAATQQYIATANFNRFNGKFQQAGVGPEMHNDANKSKRQMDAFFDVDAAANSHDGRSLKAERRAQTISKAQLKVYKAKQKQKKKDKEIKWLLD